MTVLVPTLPLAVPLVRSRERIPLRSLLAPAAAILDVALLWVFIGILLSGWFNSLLPGR